MSPLFVAVRRIALLCLPFAAVFTAGIMLSPHASAQYPGGGGYPGGPIGWVFQKHPSPLFYPFDDLYDWTGLDAGGSITYYNRTPDLLPTKGYGVYAVGDGSAPFMVGGNNSFNRSSVSPGVAGTSTYQWQWVPPNNAAGQPDLTDFPAPPLYVLGRIFLRADAISYDDPGDGTGYVGLTGSAKVADGWGYSDSIPQIPGHIPATGGDPIHRHILGPASVAGANIQVTLSPSASGSVTGTQSGNRGGLYVALAENVFPLTLSAPNPLTNPMLGDGTNQYVYDLSQPNGQLTVPASVYVPGASTPDTTWLLPHVALSVSPVMQTGAQPFTWTASDAGLYVNTTGARPGYVTGWPSGDFCYIGLPPNNSYFGNHVMTMKVDGTASQIANYQLFYTATASNWPNSDSTTPNWYFYYNQVYPAAGPDNRQYTPGSRSFDTSDANILERSSMVNIEDDAYISYAVPVFGTDVTKSPFLIFLGSLQTYGVHTFVAVCAHEQGHATAWMTPGIEDPSASRDQDMVIDSWEDTHHMNSHSPDTTGAFGPVNPSTGHIIKPDGTDDMDVPDNEVLACIPSLGAVLSNYSLWNKDWADTGIQQGVCRFLQPNPSTGVIDGFYWLFRPNANHLPSGNPGVRANSKGNYYITSLQDLQSIYPGTNIVTTLSSAQ